MTEEEMHGIFSETLEDFTIKIQDAVKHFSNLDVSLSFKREPLKREYSFDFNTERHSYNKFFFEEMVSNIALQLVKIMEFHINNINKNDLNERLITNIIEDLSLTMLFDISLEDTKAYNRIYKFTNNLQVLSAKTYETKKVNMGIIIVNNKSELIEDSTYKFDYIPLEVDMQLDELIQLEKPLLRLVDNKSVAIVLNKEYKVIGYLRKRLNATSIEDGILKIYNNKEFDLLFNSTLKNIYDFITNETSKITEKLLLTSDDEIKVLKYFEDLKNKFGEEFPAYLKSIKRVNYNPLKYIRIKNGEVQYYSNQNYYITLKNNKWRLRHFSLLSAMIFETINIDFMLFSHFYSSEAIYTSVEEELKKTFHLVSLIRKLSEENIGALFVILKADESYDDDIIQKSEAINQILQDLLTKISENPSYKYLIYDTSLKECLNIADIDKYLFALIAGVDGAVIFDDSLNVLTFGEILNNKLSNKLSAGFGARTNAAIAASNYGIAIKISEDGDIEFYNKGQLKFRI